MLKDPFTAWDGPFPYDLLKPVGATPELPHAEMLEIPFELLSQGLMSPEANHAWEELRLIERRLFVDLMMYELDPATEIAAARAAVERELADPGEPPEVDQALRIPPDLVEGLAAEVRPPEPLPAPQPAALPEVGELAEPRTHEVVEARSDGDVVVAVLRHGCVFKERVLRPAQVIVGSNLDEVTG